MLTLQHRIRKTFLHLKYAYDNDSDDNYSSGTVRNSVVDIDTQHQWQFLLKFVLGEGQHFSYKRVVGRRVVYPI